jgi:hypothetical protein
MTVVGVVQFIEHHWEVWVCNVSQSVAFFFLNQKTAPELSIPVVEAADRVAISNGLKNSWYNVRLLLSMDLPGIHLHPLISKLVYVIDSHLIDVEHDLLRQIVAKLGLSRVLAF